MARLKTAMLLASSVILMGLAGPTTVVQHRRAFNVGEVTLQAGESIVFDNQDVFNHQIYVDSTNLAFDSEEQEAGQKLSVRFPTRGRFTVLCHIHPKMKLVVVVQ